MNWNGKRIVGRFVIDIDGCLRSTDSEAIRVSELAELHGRLEPSARFVMELEGEVIALDAGDVVSLSEDRVAFFRSTSPANTLRAPVMSCYGLSLAA
jgi:hypothetical protein